MVELRVQEGDYVHVGDTLAILEVPEMKSQEQMLQATNAATEAMKDLTDAGARKEQIKGAYELVQHSAIDTAISSEAEQMGFTVETQMVEILGTCAACREAA